MKRQQSWKRVFVTIHASHAFSLIGSAAVQFAIVWWLAARTQSAVTLTTAAVMSLVPMMFLVLFVGVWTDRWNRRTVMIAADGLVALSSAVLGIAVLYTDNILTWFVYLILLARGIGNTFHTPALQAAIP